MWEPKDRSPGLSNLLYTSSRSVFFLSIHHHINRLVEFAWRIHVVSLQVGLPGFDSMPSALNMLSKHERASYCNRYWENEFKKVCNC